MKYFITGLHSSGKQEVINQLEELGIKCGKIFTNYTNPSPNIYNSLNYVQYGDEDVTNIFENNAYIFIQEFPRTQMNFNVGQFYEGLSKYEFDQNDVFVLSPDQVLALTPTSIKEDVCFVWLDNTKDNRTTRYFNEHRTYNYTERDNYEKRDLNSYVKMLYSFNNADVVYFNDEEPGRVAAVIHTMITHPDTYKLFVKKFD